MSAINNEIINRINILRNEFLQNYSCENRILFGIRNILYNIDEMSLNSIYIHLIFYYTNYHNNLVNLDNINFITNSTNNINSINDYFNFSLNTFDRDFFNYDQQLEYNSDSDDISNIDDNSDNDSDSDLDSDISYNYSNNNTFHENDTKLYS